MLPSSLIFTDGNSNINPENTIPDAIDARVKGINNVVIAVGEDLNMLELRGMANYPPSAFLHTVDTYRELDSIKDKIIESTCDGMHTRGREEEFIFFKFRLSYPLLRSFLQYVQTYSELNCIEVAALYNVRYM